MSQEKHATDYPGVRYREHDTRRHGVALDRYYYIRYKVKGVLKEEGIGWWSKGITALEANRIRGIITQNIRLGKGPQSLSEFRALKEAEQEMEMRRRDEEAKRNIPFDKLYTDKYIPAVELYKDADSIKNEKSLYNKWIKPVIGSIPLSRIELSHIEIIVSNVVSENRSKATLKYILAIISMAWNYARKNCLVLGDCPTKLCKIGKIDNERKRALTEEEAEQLLAELAKINIDLRDICILALYQGLRFGEIAKLKWSDIDISNKNIYLADTKSGTSVIINMRPVVQSILAERLKKKTLQDDLVFPARTGEKRERMSKTFSRVVERLGFNDGITDRKQLVVFHTLRHTFATWLRLHKVTLDRVKDLMRHADYKMVLRYAHIGNDELEESASTLDNIKLGLDIDINDSNIDLEDSSDTVVTRI